MILYQCQYCTWYLISLLAFVHNLRSILPFCSHPPPFYFHNDTLCFNVSLNTQSGPFHKFEVIETSSFFFVPIKYSHFVPMANLYYALMFVQMTNRVLTVWCLLFYITLSRSVMFLDLQLWALRQSYIGAGKIQVSVTWKSMFLRAGSGEGCASCNFVFLVTLRGVWVCLIMCLIVHHL